MSAINRFLTILTLGVVGGMMYTAAVHPDLITNGFNGITKLYATAGNLTLGQTTA